MHTRKEEACAFPDILISLNFTEKDVFQGGKVHPVGKQEPPCTSLQKREHYITL